MRLLSLLVLPLVVAACTKSGTLADSDGGVTTGAPEPTPVTNTCPGSDTLCLHGTVTTKGFTAPFEFARAYVYPVYPNGTAAPVGSSATSDGGNEVAKDGTFAIGNLDAADHYYLRVLARFDPADPTAVVESIVGPLTVPSTGPLDVKVRPVTLEVLQGRVAGGAGTTTLTWASARVFDPAKGHELTDATVTFHSGTQSWPLPYTTNSGGVKKTYFANIEPGTAGNTVFTFDTTHPSLGTQTWTLAGEPNSFDGVLTQPTDGSTVPLHQDLAVTWPPQPLASYEVVQLFLSQSGGFIAKYQSPAPVAPEVSAVTIPASALDTAGKYLVNVQYARTTCPASADGCVYNTSTAVANLNAQ